jgi:hypothetical protein
MASTLEEEDVRSRKGRVRASGAEDGEKALAYGN